MSNKSTIVLTALFGAVLFVSIVLSGTVWAA